MKLKKENDPNIKKVLLLNEDTIEKINELSELLALEGLDDRNYYSITLRSS